MVKSKNKNKTASLDDCCVQVTNGSDTRNQEFDGTAHLRRMYDESHIPYRIKKNEEGKWCLYLTPNKSKG